MKQPWASVDRWGPLAVSLLTFLTFIGYAWAHGERTAALEGRAEGLQRQVDQRNQIEIALRTEVQTWQAYVIDLRSKMAAARIQVPPPPLPVPASSE